MLTSTEIAQTLRRIVDRDVAVTVDTRQTVVPIELTVAQAPTNTRADRQRHGVTKQATTTLDEPVVLASHGDTTVEFTVDRLDPDSPRWVATLPDGSQQVVYGAGDVDRVAVEAGLPLMRRAS